MPENEEFPYLKKLSLLRYYVTNNHLQRTFLSYFNLNLSNLKMILCAILFVEGMKVLYLTLVQKNKRKKIPYLFPLSTRY